MSNRNSGKNKRTGKTRMNPKTQAAYCPRCKSNEVSSEFGRERSKTGTILFVALRKCGQCGKKWAV